MVRWQLHVEGFITRVQNPVLIPTQEVLLKGRSGLTKRINTEKDPDKKARLKIIRDEFDFLINNL
jgi:hypothetical protein